MNSSDAAPARTGWVALAAAALDVEGHPSFSPDVEIVAVPVDGSPPLGLLGAGARIWRRLTIEGPVPDENIDPDDRAILQELHAAALASDDGAAAFRTLRPPVLSSPVHELVYGVVAHVAALHGIGCVFLKGPILYRQGLREHEHSGDVDVLCDPRRWDDFAAALAEWGWRREPDPWHGTSVNHSATMIPLQWGCEIDVHRRVPGMTLDDEAAFAAIVSDCVRELHAGVEVTFPAVAPHAVIAALHAARPELGRPHRPPAAVAATGAMLARVPGSVSSARALGALPALRAEMEASALLGPAERAAGGRPRDWAWRAAPDRASAYLTALRDESVPNRLRLLARLLWPSADVALESARRAGEPVSGPLHARLRRLRRGLRDWSASVGARHRRRGGARRAARRRDR